MATKKISAGIVTITPAAMINPQPPCQSGCDAEAVGCVA